MSSNNSIDKIYDLAIVGGGAAGLAAAVSCAFKAKANNEKRLIVVLESNDRIGKTILRTGNGRCNFSNINIQQEGCNKYHNADFVDKVIAFCQERVCETHVFDPNKQFDDMLAPYQMFNFLGLSCEVDSQGRMYPYTKKASSVVDVFRYTLSEMPVNIYENFKVENIKLEKDYICLSKENGKSVKAKKIIIATGGTNTPLAMIKDDTKAIQPILGALKTNNKFTKNLDGIRVSAKVKLLDKTGKEITSEEGEVLFRKYGLSGICIFNLSRFLDPNTRQKIVIDYFPQLDEHDMNVVLEERYANYSQNTKSINAKRLMAGMLLPQIAVNVAKAAKLDPANIRYFDLKKLS